MSLPEFRNATYSPNGLAQIECEINHPQHGWIPFTCDPNDPYTYFDAAAFYNHMLQSGQVKPYVPPSLSQERMANDVRIERDLLLQASDWTQLPDVPQATKDLWAPYRQALRDIPLQPGFPASIIWPKRPV